MNDSLANALSTIHQAEKAAKKSCLVSPTSKTIKKVLNMLKGNKFLGDFEEVEEDNAIRVNLIGNINKCGSIKPRFSFKKDEFEKWEKRYLPAINFGIIIVSTSQGLMTHRQAKEKEIGGKLIAYCY